MKEYVDILVSSLDCKENTYRRYVGKEDGMHADGKNRQKKKSGFKFFVVFLLLYVSHIQELYSYFMWKSMHIFKNKTKN